MRPAARHPPGRRLLALGLGAALAGPLTGCAVLREEGFTQGGSCDPAVRQFDEAELRPRPDEVAGGLPIAPGSPFLAGGANGVSRVGCGPAGCGPGAPVGHGFDEPGFEAVRCVSDGTAAERANRPDLATGHYRRALMHDPACPAAHHRLAVLLDAAGQLPAAEQHYAAALAAAPDDADLLCDAGYSLLLQGRHEEAEAKLRTALTTTPDHARSLENLAVLAARRGDRTGAERALRAAGGPGVGRKLATLFPGSPVGAKPAVTLAAAADAATSVRPAVAHVPEEDPADARLPLFGGAGGGVMTPAPPRDGDALPLWSPGV